jgi:hypothetical protein
MATGTEPAEGRLGTVWRAVAAAGEETCVLSLLTFTMTFLVLYAGMADPIGIAALALQAGLLVRLNALHGQPDG